MDPRQRAIKCVVWDLDSTLWQGTLVEGDEVELRPEAIETLKGLDARGILLSVASKNEPEMGLAKLEEFGLLEYFLYPQINWGSKSASIKRIAEQLNIGIDTLAFIDDRKFERDEVHSEYPQVLCLDADSVGDLLERPEFAPRFVTVESSRRRQMYLGDMRRDKMEQSFDGPREAFLASLGMVFEINLAEEMDLTRLEELVARTNQLNTTGRNYSLADLDRFRTSEEYDLLVACLSDRYGDYGKIGMAVVEKKRQLWTVKAFLMSCRVVSHGVGTVFINWIINRAFSSGVQLCVEIVPNDRNRMMYATYRFAGFRHVGSCHGAELLEREVSGMAAYPDYVDVISLVDSFVK